MPAGQRLETGDRAGGEIDDRLEGERQLAGLQRAAQLGFDAEAAADRAHLAGMIGLDPAAGLAALECELRVADQIFRIGGGFGVERDADRAGDADLELAEPERRGERPADALCRAGRLAMALLHVEQHR